MAAPVKKNEQKKTESTVFNLSRYLRVYVKNEDEPAEDDNIRGVMISGYRKDSAGNKQYCNIWIDRDYFIKNRSDGCYSLSVRMVELEVK